MAENALPIMGHVLLGHAIESGPAELNDKNNYVQLPENSEYDPYNVNVRCVPLYVGSVGQLFSDDCITTVLSHIKRELTSALSDKNNKVVARSLRLLVTFKPTVATFDIQFTLMWLTARV